MKINWNKICFLILGSIALAGCIILSSLLLFSNFHLLQYCSLIFTYGFGIYLIKTKNKYPLFK